MAFVKRIWSKGNIVKAEHLNRYEEALESHEETIEQIEQLKATKTELADAVAPKADKTYVDSQDALKATKVELTNAVAPLAEKTYVDEQLALKADQSYVESQDALKATKVELADAVALKADKTYVDGLNALKATKTELTVAVAPKADKSYVDAEDAKKADKTYVDAEDAKKATKTELSAAVALKADKTYVDGLNAVKATKTELNAAIADKAQKTYVDGHVNTYKGMLEESARETQYLQPGVNVLNADVATPVDIEIQGRTLTSLANSNLEANKYYALADPKMRVIVDKKNVQGVGKFQKGTTTLTTADFVGKLVANDSNPHKYRLITGTELKKPSDFTYESQVHIDRLQGNEGSYSSGTTSGLNQIPQHLFSFNVVAQIEKELGIIPVTTFEEKVVWVRNNVNNLTFNWYGFGFNHSGNKASISRWQPGSEEWQFNRDTTASSPTKLTSGGSSNYGQYVEDDGLIHFLAYSEPSDGTTPTNINTDYAKLDIELKSTAQLNTRGKIIRVENFEGKVAGSTKENPHISKTHWDVNLRSPDNFGGTTENSTLMYNNIETSENDKGLMHQLVGNNKAQKLFSFNLIEAIERRVGKIPFETPEAKVGWIKTNVSKLRFNWDGYGSSPAGNLVTAKAWWVGGEWSSSQKASHTNGFVSKLAIEVASIISYVNADGFIHFIVYAESSDGVTASKVYTSYLELEIELKPTADFSAPKVPLYEVSKEEYDKIGIQWDDAEVKKRFPAVEGTQHITNPYLEVAGENLLPPFTEWSLHENAKINAPYELELNALQTAQRSLVSVPTKMGETYTLIPDGGIYLIRKSDNTFLVSTGGKTPVTFTAQSDITNIQTENNTTGVVVYSRPMLTVGSKSKPFVPRNPSYLQVQEKLGAIGDKKDVLFKEGGKWKLKKALQKDEAIVSSGYLHTSYSDYNLMGIEPTKSPPLEGNPIILNGIVYKHYHTDSSAKPFTWRVRTTTGSNEILFRVPKNVSEGISGAISYVMPSPEVKEVTVEGDIFADGLTQIAVGSGYVSREKVNPVLSGSNYIINLGSLPETHLKNKPAAFVALYKNGVVTDKLSVVSSIWSNGGFHIDIPVADFDTTAEYTISYLIEKVTNTAVDVKATFAKNIRSAHDDLAVKSSDNATLLSVHERAIVDMYIRLKALEAN